MPMILYQLHQRGVDQFQAESVKQTEYGKVTMTIDFDRLDPAADRLRLRQRGRFGWTFRDETLTGAQVLAVVDSFMQPTTQATTTQEQAAAEQQAEKRIHRITAATQPSQ